MEENVQFLTSNLLTKAGIKHGWFMRYGGVSSGLFQSLNGKKGSGDSDNNVNENRKRAYAALYHPDLSVLIDRRAELVSGSQTTSLAHITHAFKTDILSAIKAGEYNGYDASYTTSSDVVLSQTTADCASVIISDIKGSVVGQVHGSWHTLSAKIICELVAKIKMTTNSQLVAGIGPMICKNCYEFGAEATEIFDPKYLSSKNNTFLVDLKLLVIDQLKESGVKQIDDLGICTLEDDRFYSHRRSGARSGRMITLAARG